MTIVIISCNGQSNKKEPLSKTDIQTSIDDKENVKVYINKKGEISINGKVKKLEELDSIFKSLKEKSGIIYYSRSEEYDGEIWMEVLDLVSKYELPIALYKDKGFTKRIGN